jgi:hypothetical protein
MWEPPFLKIILNYEIPPKSPKGMQLNTERILQFPELLLKQRGYGSGPCRLPPSFYEEFCFIE